ncbi:MAG: cytochrome C554 [Candidatus Aminicenantes bacterium]|nr:MAG: cytochrome C554 [Candidatus Aminicenantes bacterium]
MKKIVIISFVAIACFFITNLFSQEFTYVGAAKCKMCHKSEKQGQQFPLWEARKHSKSFSALASDKAKEIAQGAGIDNPAESPKCFKCHAPLAEKAPELKEEGVGCEVCHGPGSAYKKMSVMKDHAESVKNGMTEYGSPEAIKKQCLSCHENAHGNTFDFDAAWEKAKHPRPKE